MDYAEKQADGSYIVRPATAEEIMEADVETLISGYTRAHTELCMRRGLLTAEQRAKLMLWSRAMTACMCDGKVCNAFEPCREGCGR